jgi:xylulokinase
VSALVAGVDSSTQSTKVEIRELESGSIVARASSPHPSTNPPVSEQEPDAWWSALVDCFSQLESHRGDVRAISIGAQQHGLVLLDEAGGTLRPAKLWNDTTSAPQAAHLVATHGPDAWASACGSVPVAAFTITKLAWVLQHEPELADQVAMVMLPHDYLTWRLSGEHVTDRGDASGTGWFDPRSNSYIDALIDHVAPAEVWKPRLAKVLMPDEAAGEVTGEARSALGLEPGVIVGPGTGDNMAAALGLGLGPADIVMSLGTSGTIYAMSNRATADPTGAVAGFADAVGGFLPLACTLNATKVTDTVARWLGTDAVGLSGLALEAVSRADGPVLVPYFDGERTPDLPTAAGLFAGLRNDTSRADLALAAHDGVLCGLLAGLDALMAAGVDTSGRLLLIGGGARSSAYQKRAANLHGAPIVVPADDETVATGAAVQAAWVLVGQSALAVAESWHLGEGVTIEPDAGGGTAEIRDRYRSLADEFMA